MTKPLLALALTTALSGLAATSGAAMPIAGTSHTAADAAASALVPASYDGLYSRERDARARVRLSQLGYSDLAYRRYQDGCYYYSGYDASSFAVTIAIDGINLVIRSIERDHGYPGRPGNNYGRYLTERDIERQLLYGGYRISHIDRRGDRYFVRVFYRSEEYYGYISARNGMWLERTRVYAKRGKDDYKRGKDYYRWDRGKDDKDRRWDDHDRNRNRGQGRDTWYRGDAAPISKGDGDD